MIPNSPEASATTTHHYIMNGFYLSRMCMFDVKCGWIKANVNWNETRLVCCCLSTMAALKSWDIILQPINRSHFLLHPAIHLHNTLLVCTCYIITHIHTHTNRIYSFVWSEFLSPPSIFRRVESPHLSSCGKQTHAAFCSCFLLMHPFASCNLTLHRSTKSAVKQTSRVPIVAFRMLAHIYSPA